MKASWEKLENNQGVISVEVEAEQVNVALNKAFKKVVGKVNVPGFRKGKVPRQIFEAKFGVESLYQDAIDILLPEVYVEALKETKVEPIDRPEIDIEEFAKGENFKFTAKVQLKPEAKLGEYKGIEIPETEVTVTSEEIEQELKTMQQRHAELVVLEEGVAENGDTAIIDFEGFLNEVPFEGGKAENHSLELGSGSFIPGFEDQVIGMGKADEKDIQVTFPAEYQSEELAGKEVVFKVKLHEIKRKNLPELDDEFAKDVSEFETLDEYKQDIEKTMKEKKEQSNKSAQENAVVDKATEAAEVEVPQVMIESETDQMLQDFANRLRMQGMNLDSYYQFSGQDESALKEQMKVDAKKRVKQNLVLEAIAKEESIDVTEDEINEELAKMAEMYKKTTEELKELLTANGNIDGLEKDLMMRKTVQFLVEQAKVVTEVS